MLSKKCHFFMQKMCKKKYKFYIVYIVVLQFIMRGYIAKLSHKLSHKMSYSMSHKLSLLYKLNKNKLN